MSEKLICWRCRDLTTYHIEEKNRYFAVQDKLFPYVYKYGICDKCGEQIAVPGLDDENSARIDKAIKEGRNAARKF